jgi:hypothetical protein
MEPRTRKREDATEAWGTFPIFASFRQHPSERSLSSHSVDPTPLLDHTKLTAFHPGRPGAPSTSLHWKGQRE